LDRFDMSVLLWGRAEEPVVAAVAKKLTAAGVSVLAADTPDIVSVEHYGDLVTCGGRRVTLARVSGVLVRPEAAVADPGVYASLAAWTELTSAIVLNRLSAAGSNRSKPFQLRLISSAGFAVPDTLITTDPNDVRAFWAEHGQVIYKSTSGVRSIVGLLGPRHEARLGDVCSCPTQFQQYVVGVDHRVHVVGDRLFACEVRSGAVDYRYAPWSGHQIAMCPVALPDDISERCLTLAKALKLDLAGIDLRHAADGQWWCFEVNTSPGFVWFEEQTKQPIAGAVATLLARSGTEV
jgi:glutathione synthase/RimK-type ligase-like ATP-grasp enzyme